METSEREDLVFPRACQFGNICRPQAGQKIQRVRTQECGTINAINPRFAPLKAQLVTVRLIGEFNRKAAANAAPWRATG